jgi:DNA-binding LacI/PurR family transcriptional regulator
MNVRKTTIIDIAKSLGISPSTVSRALKDDYQISKKTRDAVVEAAKRLNYTPNPMARGLLSKKSHLIGIIVPDIANHFCSNIISSIGKGLKDTGYHSMVFQSNESFLAEIELSETIIKLGVDGLLVSVSRETVNYDHLKKIIELGLPMVMFDRVIKKLNAPRVKVDNYIGAFRAVEHLIEKGRKRIVHIAGPQSLNIAKERKEGYLAALKKHGLSIDTNLIVYDELNRVGSPESIMKIIKQEAGFDAVFCAANPLGTYKELIKQGYKIPGEISIVGFSDDPYLEYFEPSISTVKQPIEEIGRTAIELLLEEIKKPGFQKKDIVLEPELIIRESSL